MSIDTSAESSCVLSYYYKRKIWCWFTLIGAFVCCVLFFIEAMENIGLIISALGLGISSYFISPHKKEIDLSQGIIELMLTEGFWSFFWELITFPVRLLIELIAHGLNALTF